MRADHAARHPRRPDGPRRGGAGTRRGRSPTLFDAVLFDRDGTLVHDVPYNGNPARVRPVAGARPALDRLRAAGLRLGVVTNQSGLARGLFDPVDLFRVNSRIEQLLGPFDTWQVCPHAEAVPGAGCRCRKPAPGLIHRAARALGTVPARCVVVGDIGADMVAAAAAGAAAILVPTAATRPAEVAAATSVVDLPAAVEAILARERRILVGRTNPVDRPNLVGRRDGAVRRDGADRRRPGTVLVARTDSAGDVLLTGPAVRAVAAGGDRVVLLCGPRGRAAAELLPGVDEVIEWGLSWIDADPEPVTRAGVDRLVDRLAAVGADEAVLFTSFHQSPLPLALALRMAGVGRISAISDDYPGSLLDVRHRVPPGVPEPERALSLAAAAGFALPAGDEPNLRVRRPARLPPDLAAITPGYVVVHPGSSADARAIPADLAARVVTTLAHAGYRVVVTGGSAEAAVCAAVAGGDGTDLSGRTLLPELAAVIERAACLVVGNTGPAHLAAAVGTPVVSLFAPTVPYGQWGPYRVPAVRLGDATAACRDTRARRCPLPGHPCLSSVRPTDVLAAVDVLTAGPPGGFAADPAGRAAPEPVPGAARSRTALPAGGRVVR